MAAARNIFLTGGTGFFGKSILSQVLRGKLSDGYRFTVLSRDPAAFKRRCPEFAELANVRFVAGDVRDFAFPDGEFDTVIHGAAPAVTTLAPGEMRSIIMEGTQRVLDFARRCGARTLMMISSGGVYGVQPPELPALTEDHPCRPVNEYGIAKLDAEKLCLDSGIHQVVVPRCFAFVGPYLNRDIHFAIGNFIRDALEKKPVVVNGDGTPLRTYLYADDLVEWLFALLECGRDRLICNVGSDEAVSIAELAKIVRDELEPGGEVRVLGIPDPAKAIGRYVPSIRLAESLGLRVKVGLREAIRRSAGVI